MIPYWNIPTLSLGPFTISIWGVMVALGVLVGAWIAGKRAGERKNIILDRAFWIVIAGFIGARVGEVLFYDPKFYLANPSEIIKIWHGGLSSYGGFLGAAIVLWWFYGRRPKTTNYPDRSRDPESLNKERKLLDRDKLQTKNLFWHDADALAWGFVPGWFLGRIGCFLIHDHPGTLTHFILGVKFPDGVRHDLGLYDAILALGILAIFLVARRKPRGAGWYAKTLMLIYPTIRFFLDFLRAGPPISDDLRYFGLTAAQYGSIIVLAIMLCSMVARRKQTYGSVPSPSNSVQ